MALWIVPSWRLKNEGVFRMGLVARVAGMSGNHFLHFGKGMGKPKKFSRCSEQEQDIQDTIPVVLDGNAKYKKPFP